jgi:hypothetical protein
MELLTAELRARLPALYSQEHDQDPMVHVSFSPPTQAGLGWSPKGRQTMTISFSSAMSSDSKKNGVTSCCRNWNQFGARLG